MKTIRTASGQRAMNVALRTSLKSLGAETGPFVVTYPGGRHDVDGVYFDEVDLWVGFTDYVGSRWWQGFNVGNPTATPDAQQIAVEINIPMQEARKGIQGVALEDDQGRYWLGHRGRLGGNSASIGAGFLEWYPDGRAVVLDQDKETEVILIGRVDDAHLPALLRRFVDLAILYKAGGSQTGPITSDSFKPEFTGEKAVAVIKDTYLAHGTHGIVVQALRDQLAAQGVVAFNDKHRDLYVGPAKAMMACFEVKSSASSTDCYTALGQLFIHGGNAVHRIVVVPAGPMNFEDAVLRTGVQIVRYDLNAGRVTFIGLQALIKVMQS